MGAGVNRGLTKEQLDAFVESLETGAGFEQSLAAAEIPRRKGYRWRKRGEAHRDEGTESLYAILAREWEKAAAKRVADAEAYVHGAKDLDDETLSAKDKLHNARWILSKLARADYGDKTEIQIRGEIEGICEAVKPHMSGSAYAEMIHAFAAVAGLDSVTGDGDARDQDPLPLH